MSDDLKCQHEGCDRYAKFMPVVFVSAMGWAVAPHQAVRAEIKLFVCGKHKHTVMAAPVRRFIGPQLRLDINDLHRRGGRAKGDFDNAWIEMIPIEKSTFWKNRKNGVAA